MSKTYFTIHNIPKYVVEIERVRKEPPLTTWNHVFCSTYEEAHEEYELYRPLKDVASVSIASIDTYIFASDIKENHHEF